VAKKSGLKKKWAKKEGGKKRRNTSAKIVG